MPNPTSNILPFPAKRPFPTGAPSETGPAELPAIVRAIMQKPSDEDREDHAAEIVRAAIRFGTRSKDGSKRIPRSLRRWLDELCDEGSSACLMVRDWLDDNRRYLGSGVDGEEASASAAASHGVSAGEGQ